MKSFFEEFKTFAVRGNVIDLAVAVVVGTAFGKIVTSLVDNLITPLIGIFMGGVDFSELSYTVGDAAFMYGAFIQSIIDFIIVALVIFIVVKTINKLQEPDEPEAKSEEKPAEPSEEIKLLTEIRDTLKR